MKVKDEGKFIDMVKLDCGQGWRERGKNNGSTKKRKQQLKNQIIFLTSLMFFFSNNKCFHLSHDHCNKTER